MLFHLKNGRRIQAWFAVRIAHIDLISATRYDDRNACWVDPIVYRLRFTKTTGWRRCFREKRPEYLAIEEVRKILKRWQAT